MVSSTPSVAGLQVAPPAWGTLLCPWAPHTSRVQTASRGLPRGPASPPPTAPALCASAASRPAVRVPDGAWLHKDAGSARPPGRGCHLVGHREGAWHLPSRALSSLRQQLSPNRSLLHPLPPRLPRALGVSGSPGGAGRPSAVKAVSGQAGPRGVAGQAVSLRLLVQASPFVPRVCTVTAFSHWVFLSCAPGLQLFGSCSKGLWELACASVQFC